MKRGVNAYANVGLETGVGAASPHQLVVMLFDGALVSVLSAQTHMKAGNIAAKGAAISKAITIIDNGLRAALDHKAGGEIAANLDALYDYMGRRLLQANLDNDGAILEEVRKLLADLRETWNAIGPQVAQAQPAQANAANTNLTLASA
jgi:flagellar protein FliS